MGLRRLVGDALAWRPSIAPIKPMAPGTIAPELIAKERRSLAGAIAGHVTRHEAGKRLPAVTPWRRRSA